LNARMRTQFGYDCTRKVNVRVVMMWDWRRRKLRSGDCQLVKRIGSSSRFKAADRSQIRCCSCEDGWAIERQRRVHCCRSGSNTARYTVPQQHSDNQAIINKILRFSILRGYDSSSLRYKRNLFRVRLTPPVPEMDYSQLIYTCGHVCWIDKLKNILMLLF